ncbi:MAG: hypothetical protein AMXMBFR47_36980 [Planctomycetota bacterium]
MKLTPWLLLVALVATQPGFGGIWTSVDLLDPSDGGAQPPPGILCVDVLIDAAGDVWTAGGMRAFVTPMGLAEGITIRYSAIPDDPNTPHREYLLNPSPDERFVTFLTKPRGRDDDVRYTDGGAAIAGAFMPSGLFETASETELNAAWYASPPEGPGSPSVDGAVARVAIDASMFLSRHPLFEAFHVGPPRSATGPILVESSTDEGVDGTINVGFDTPTPNGTDWAVWYTEIPEPSSAVFLSLGIVVFRRIQRLRG